MKTFFHFLNFGLIGAGIGSIVTTLSLLLTGATGASMTELTAWLVTSFLIGIYNMFNFLNPHTVWLGFVHLPLVIISLYCAILSYKVKQ